MNYVLILFFSAAAITLLLMGFAYRRGSRTLSAGADAPSADREYWKAMTKKMTTGFFVGAIGAVLTAFAIALNLPVPAEIGCITLLAAMVFLLAFLCRKLNFQPCDATEKLQKKWKIIFLVLSFAALFLTQMVFQYFNQLK